MATAIAQEGQLVGNVDPGSPAIAAGVKKGDRIVEVRGDGTQAVLQRPLSSPSGSTLIRQGTSDPVCVTHHPL